jgi:hypothetical protein
MRSTSRSAGDRGGAERVIAAAAIGSVLAYHRAARITRSRRRVRRLRPLVAGRARTANIVCCIIDAPPRGRYSGDRLGTVATVCARGGGVISGTTDSLLNSLAGPGGELCAVLQPDLGERVADVALDRAHREVQP